MNYDKEKLDNFIDDKYIEIENNIKLMETCDKVKKSMIDLDVNVNMKYVDMYNNILLNNSNILSTDNLLDILNKNTEKSIIEDTQIQKQLDIIDNIKEQINDKFKYRFNLCNEYINYYNETKIETNELYKMYNVNIIELIEKNKQYNEMIDFLLEEYNKKFIDYKQKIKLEYPKNYIIQLIVNMIILQDNRSKTNIKFKNVMIQELETQKKEIQKQTNLIDKVNLNSSIIKECYNINEIIDNLNDNLNHNLTNNDIDIYK